jgi:hypothetical protein
VPACLTVGEANGCQFQEIAKHGHEVSGIDSITARLRGRLFFHFQLSASRSGLCGFSHTWWAGAAEGAREKDNPW